MEWSVLNRLQLVIFHPALVVKNKPALTNMLTGKKLSLTKGDMLDVKIHTNRILAEYQLNPIDLFDTPAAQAKMQSHAS